MCRGEHGTVGKSEGQRETDLASNFKFNPSDSVHLGKFFLSSLSLSPSPRSNPCVFSMCIYIDVSRLCVFHQSQPYRFETGPLADTVETRLADKPRGPPVSTPQHSGYRHTQPSLPYVAEGSKPGLHTYPEIPLPRALSPAPCLFGCLLGWFLCCCFGFLALIQ